MGASIQERRRLIKIQPIKAWWSDDATVMDVLNDLGRLTRYLLKGTADIADLLSNLRREDQGIVIGKRVGISEGLTPNARKKHAAERESLSKTRDAGHKFCDIDDYSRRRHLLRYAEPDLDLGR